MQNGILKEMGIFLKAAKAGRTRIVINELLIVIDAEFRKEMRKHVGIASVVTDMAR